MNKSYYRTDFLYPRSGFIIGAGSILGVFYPYFRYNVSLSGAQADKTAIESDFGTIGVDIKKAMEAIQI